MKQSYRVLKILISVIVLIILIIKSEIVVSAATEGLALCIRVIIPTLFPFFVVTTYMNQMLLGMSVPGIRILCRALKIPHGGDSLLLLGLTGGYPVGAQLIGNSYRRNGLTRHTAEILLGYCSNAGPAFIFGVAGTLFGSIKHPLILWLIHVLSALITGYLLPKPIQREINQEQNQCVTVMAAVRQSIGICASVCACIVLFKAILSIAETVFTQKCMTLLSGFLELSNGCMQLVDFPCPADRFLLCSAFLSFGGLCVMLQTASVTGKLGLGLYIPGKIMQTIISLLLSILLSPILFPESLHFLQMSHYYLILFIPVLLLTRKYTEKRCGNPNKNKL